MDLLPVNMPLQAYKRRATCLRFFRTKDRTSTTTQRSNRLLILCDVRGEGRISSQLTNEQAVHPSNLPSHQNISTLAGGKSSIGSLARYNVSVDRVRTKDVAVEGRRVLTIDIVPLSSCEGLPWALRRYERSLARPVLINDEV